jgi:putative ABC transport system permease protein
MGHNKFTSGINILSLAIGLTVALIVMLFVQHELSYDRWIPNAENIYRYENEIHQSGGRSIILAEAPPVTAGVLRSRFSEIEAITRFHINYHSLHRPDQVHYEVMAFAEQNFFEVLDIPLLEGDKATALAGVSSVILSEAMVLKYFGNEPAMGQFLTVETVDGGEKRDFKVTGVFRDIPKNSHLDLKFILSNQAGDDGFGFYEKGEWNNFMAYTYLRLAEGARPELIEAEFPAILDEFVDTSRREEGTTGSEMYTGSLTRLTDLHMNQKNRQPMRPKGDWGLMLALMSIAALILAIASINFTNLALARSLSRAREISIRKVHGAGRRQLLSQYLLETAILTLLALGLAIFAVFAALPFLNAFIGKDLALDALLTIEMVAVVFLLLSSVAIMAGLYPALVLSSYRPAVVFSGLHGKGGKGRRLRTALVVFQFTISITLGIGATVIQSQRQYTATRDLGFSTQDKLVLRWMNWGHFAEKAEVINERIRAHPDVIGTAFSNIVPGDLYLGNVNMRVSGYTGEEPVRGRPINADEGFFEAYELELLAGRFLNREFGQDNALVGVDLDEQEDPIELSVVLSESAVRLLGIESSESALGEIVDVSERLLVPEVVGVVRDFHFTSLRQEVMPTIFYMDSSGFSNLTVRFREHTDVPALVRDITAIWKDFIPRDPITLEYLNQNIANLYENDRKQGMMVTTLAALALLVACLGLHGLSALTATEKAREVSIRKVHGAPIHAIVSLLLWQFSIPVVIAIGIACPLGWFGSRQYLDQFSYRIDLGPVFFIGAGLAALAIAGLTVGGHAFKVARTNPIHALRERE